MLRNKLLNTTSRFPFMVGTPWSHADEIIKQKRERFIAMMSQAMGEKQKPAGE